MVNGPVTLDLKLLPLIRTPGDAAKLQAAHEATPKYSWSVSGGPPDSSDGQGTLDVLPPGAGYDKKFVYGVHLNTEMIGGVDLIRGWPHSDTAMLGLLFIVEDYQGRGLGRLSYDLTEALVRRWKEINRIRIGIVESNISAFGFWKRLGFIDTGERKAHECGRCVSTTWIFQKEIT